jgi:hypothetical protein
MIDKYLEAEQNEKSAEKARIFLSKYRAVEREVLGARRAVEHLEATLSTEDPSVTAANTILGVVDQISKRLTTKGSGIFGGGIPSGIILRDLFRSQAGHLIAECNRYRSALTEQLPGAKKRLAEAERTWTKVQSEAKQLEESSRASA